MILLISYDLSKRDKDYSPLYNAIKKAPSWWHYLQSTWLIKTDLSPSKWVNLLRPHIDENDALLIVEITGNRQGWLTKKAWDWIEKHSPRTTERTSA